MVRRGRRRRVDPLQSPIAYGGFKSTEGAHERAVDAVRDALGQRAEAGRVDALLKVIKKKDSASYQGEYYTVAEARGLLETLEAFARWAEKLFERRP